jgi:hypothetical protein
LQAAKWPSYDERVQEEFVHRYELLPLTSYWQSHRSQAFPDSILDRHEEQDGFLMDYVGDGTGQVPFGWSDALRGRHLRRYGAGLREIPGVPPWDNRERGSSHASMVELWKLSGFALWDQKRVEALKRLRRFEYFQTGFVLDRSSCT